MATTLYLLVFFSSANFALDQGESFRAGETVVLQCNGQAEHSDSYLWTDESASPPILLYIVSKTISKTDAARNNEKYDNFYINSSFPSSVDLVIRQIEVGDSGTFTCELLIDNSKVRKHIVRVEVPPSCSAVTCGTSNYCSTQMTDSESSMFECICTMSNASPDDLEIMWVQTNGSATYVSKHGVEPHETYNFSSQASLQPTKSKNFVSCLLTGYVTEIERSLRSSFYSFEPPSCYLEFDVDETCVTASIMCICSGGNPDVYTYTFYDEYKTVFGSQQHIPVVHNVTILPRKNITFYCKGCNGVNYGDNATGYKTLYCNPDSSSKVPAVEAMINLGVASVLVIYVLNA